MSAPQPPVSSLPLLILASGSPRRRELLAEAGYEFVVVPPAENVECGVCSEMGPAGLVAEYAFRKAAAVVRQLQNNPIDPLPGNSRQSAPIVIAADTVAECDGFVLGKPRDEADARSMLTQLSGREHRVLTGLCLWRPGESEPQVRVAVTRLRMDVLSGRQLDEYLSSGQWEGKAGAFGYQDRLGWVRVVEGSESNVVGLPMEMLAQMLNDSTPGEWATRGEGKFALPLVAEDAKVEGMKLRVGVVGLGQAWETRHAPALRALADRFEVRAFCDPVSHRAKEIAQRWPARTCDGFRALASSADVDAVLLLSARWYGALPIMAACDAGKAIYCSAALDLDTSAAADVRTRVRDAGIAFMAEFPCRLAPATLRLKELMATRLGLPRLLFCNRRSTSPRDHNHSFYTSDMRQLIEMVDWCRDVVGSEATSVVGAAHASAPLGCAARHEIAPKDYLVMALDFSPPGEVGTGPVAQIACGSYVAPECHEAAAFRRPADLQVVCQRGIAFLDLPHTLVWFDEAGQHSELLDHDRPVGEQLFLHFHRQVNSLVLKTSSLEDAYRALAIVNKAQESYLKGCRLELE